VIDDRIKAALGVHHEIGYGHFTARNKSRDPSQQPDRDHEAADQLDKGADIHYSGAGAVTARWKTEKFLTAMRSEEKAHEQPHDAIGRIRETRQRVHAARLFGQPPDVKIIGGALVSIVILKRSATGRRN
jgi:hypothetical protein